jgi:hypothetical protein
MVARYFKNNRCSSMSLSGCLPKFEFKYFLNLIHVVTFHMSQVLFFWFNYISKYWNSDLNQFLGNSQTYFVFEKIPSYHTFIEQKEQ